MAMAMAMDDDYGYGWLWLWLWMTTMAMDGYGYDYDYGYGCLMVFLHHRRAAVPPGLNPPLLHLVASHLATSSPLDRFEAQSPPSALSAPLPRGARTPFSPSSSFYSPTSSKVCTACCAVLCCAV